MMSRASVILYLVIGFNAAAVAQSGLLQNGSFEEGLEGWQKVGRVSCDATVSRAGKSSALIQRSSSENERAWWGLQQRVRVEPEAPYRVSLRLRQEDAKRAHVKLRWLDEADKEISASAVRQAVDGSHDWQKAACELVAPGDARQAEIVVWSWYPDKGESKVWVDDVRFVSRAMQQISPQEAAGFLKAGGKPRIAFVGLKEGSGGSMVPVLDPAYRRRLYELGYACDACPVRELREGRLPAWLRNCNVIAFTQFTLRQAPPFSAQSVEELRRFVDKGGGLLLVAGMSGYGDPDALAGNINEMLAPFQARILREEVSDEEGKEVYDKGVINYTYYWTSNVEAGHPVTAGLHGIWYPGGGGQMAVPMATYTMEVNEAWTVLVRGSRTARCKTYSTEPPLVAGREYGKGRVAIATFDPRRCITDGYHPAYGGFVEKGDTFRLLCQLYDWLGEPSLRAGRIYSEAYEDLPGPLEESHPQSEPVPDADLASLAEKLKTVPTLNTYQGVIGTHSSLSDGGASVAEFCAEARKLGYDFVVFTETYEKMDESKWGQLVKVCQQESSEKFLAIPGLQINMADGERVVFNLSRFVRADEAVGRASALLFNLRWPTVVLSQPNRNRRNAWQNRFYTGLALFTYEGGELVDEATALYRQLSASDYRLIPVAINKVYSLEELRATKGQVVTRVNAKSLSEMVKHSDWQHRGPLRTIYGCGTSYVSNGPVLEHFVVATKDSVCGYAGQYPVYPGHKELVSLSVRSDAPLKDVTLFKGDYLWRRFFPKSNLFATMASSVSDRDDAPLSLFARDAAGRILQSNSLRKPTNPFFSYTLCVDKQNSILALGGLGMTAGWIAGSDVGAVFPVLPPTEIAPAGEDASWCPISSFEMRPNFHLSEPVFRRLAEVPEGQPTDQSGYESRRCLLSSPDCVVTEETYEKAFVSARMRCLYFRPRPHGISSIVIEQQIKLQKDVPLEQPSVTLLCLMSSTAINLYPKFIVCDADGRTESGDAVLKEIKDGSHPLRTVRLRQGSYLCLHGLPTGAVAILPLTNQPFEGIVGITTSARHAFVSGKRRERNFMEVRLNVAGEVIKAGTEWKTAFLFLLDNRPQWQPQQLEALAQTYGLRDKGLESKITMLQGERDHSRLYPFTIKAKNGCAVAAVQDSDLPLGLPVTVTGLNRNRDAGVYNEQSKRLWRIGIVGDEGYALLDASRGGTYFIGNLIECDKSEVRLTLEEADTGGARFTVHNPTDADVTTVIQRPKELQLYPAFRHEALLAPGDTVSATVP